MEPHAGAKLGAYRIERKVGEGSFGAVWCGLHEETGERVALKVLLPAAAANQEQVTRFRRESKLLGLVQSAHVARMVDVLVDSKFGLVLVMEFIDGELLSDLLAVSRLTYEETIDIGAQVLDGVCDLHAAGIIHRDIKPNNIMLCTTPDGPRRAVVFDLGLSRMLRAATSNDDSTRSLTGSHVALGTIECMAPEQVLNARDVTVRSDVYSIGTILYRALTGHYPFASDDERDVARRKLTVEAPELSVPPGDPLATGLREIVMKSLRRRPSQRYETAQQMRDELQTLCMQAAGRALQASQRDSLPSLPERPRVTAKDALIAFLVGLAVFSAIVGAVLAWRMQSR